MLGRVILLCVLLAGCTGGLGGPVVFNDGKNQQYFTKGTVSLGGRVPVSVFGTVPGDDTAGFVGILKTPGYQPSAAFELADDTTGAPGMRFVFAFGVADNTRLCTRPAAGRDPGLVAAALCNGTDIVTRATLRLGGASLENAIPSLMRTLLPRPTRTNNDSSN
ncbi:MAG: hypothetical protein AAGC92_03070 [Pseudomonadota bacterium]